MIDSLIGNVQVADLKLSGGRGADREVSPSLIPHSPQSATVPEVPGGNVLRLYAQVAQDVCHGTSVAPDFAHALTQHHLIDAIEKAAESRKTQIIPPASLVASESTADAVSV